MTLVSLSEIQHTMPQFCVRGQPSEEILIERISSFHDADRKSLVFVSQPKFLQEALNSAAGVVLTSEKILGSVPGLTTDKTVLLHPNPDLALATLIRKYFGRNIRTAKWWDDLVHPTAAISPTAKLGTNVLVGPGAVISSHCTIGDDVYIGANVTVEEGVTIGAGTVLHPNCFIGHHCLIGHTCEILPNTTIGSDGFGYAHTAQGEHFRVPHLGRVVIGNHVDIGANCAIDRGTLQDTLIGDGTIMDNLCHVAHNCQIGKHCVITAHFIAAGSAIIGDYVVIGGRTSISGHLKVASHVHIAAHSAVSFDVEKPGQYGGFPLQPLQSYLKTTSSLAHIPAMRRQLAQLIKKVFPEGEQAK